jgi:hypothetical protein
MNCSTTAQSVGAGNIRRKVKQEEKRRRNPKQANEEKDEESGSNCIMNKAQIMRANQQRQLAKVKPLDKDERKEEKKKKKKKNSNQKEADEKR